MILSLAWTSALSKPPVLLDRPLNRRLFDYLASLRKAGGKLDADEMDTAILARRYRYLWTGEAASATIFVILLIAGAAREGVWTNWIVRAYSIGVVVFILVQAVVFWRLKLRLLAQHQHDLPAEVVRRFHYFKHLNWILIGIFPLVVLVSWLVAGRSLNSADVWLGMLFLLGAILEQINYYYYQLVYGTRYDWRYLMLHKRLRSGSIAKVLTPRIPGSEQQNVL